MLLWLMHHLSSGQVTKGHSFFLASVENSLHRGSNLKEQCDSPPASHDLWMATQMSTSLKGDSCDVYTQILSNSQQLLLCASGRELESSLPGAHSGYIQLSESSLRLCRRLKDRLTQLTLSRERALSRGGEVRKSVGLGWVCIHSSGLQSDFL